MSISTIILFALFSRQLHTRIVSLSDVISMESLPLKFYMVKYQGTSIANQNSWIVVGEELNKYMFSHY